MKKVLIIDDDRAITGLLKALLTKTGYDVITSNDGREGMEFARLKSPDIVITDYEMPEVSGMDVVRYMKEQQPEIPVVVLTCHSDVSLTIKMIQAGAYDYIEKPIQPQKLLETIRNGINASMRDRHLEEQTPRATQRVVAENFLVGLTPEIRDLVKQIGRISMTRMHVMITGEPGVGKSQVARLIHYSGVTRDDPFVVMNCETHNDKNAEAELIGHTRDAYGQIGRARNGKVVQAGEGTLLLNGIEHIPVPVQQKLSRIIADREVHVPGKDTPLPFEGRVIMTTTKSVEQLMNDGLLHGDLYYQLKVFLIHLPPLRHRLGDIHELVDYFIEKYSKMQSKSFLGLEEGTMDLIKKHDWPGNLQELENAIAQAIALSRGNLIEKEHIRLFTKGVTYMGEYKAIPDKRLTLDDIEKQYIKAVLDDVNWVKSEAAEVLQITRPTLNAKIVKYELKR